MKRLFMTLALLLALSSFATPAFAKATKVPDAIWAHGVLYGTVVTPTQLPDRGKFDAIYTFPPQSGQRSISESAPGDQDFNGGRWEVYEVTLRDGWTPSPELTSYEQLLEQEVLGNLTIGTTVVKRFVCTMLPQ